MKSELSFLLELVLDDSIPKPIKTRLVARIKDVEKAYAGGERNMVSDVPRRAQPAVVQTQAPSMQRIMERNPDLVPKPPTPETPAAAAALAARQALLMNAGNEKPEPGRRSPRKI